MLRRLNSFFMRIKTMGIGTENFCRVTDRKNKMYNEPPKIRSTEGLTNSFPDPKIKVGPLTGRWPQ